MMKIIEVIGINDILVNEKMNQYSLITNKILSTSVSVDIALIYLVKPVPKVIKSVE